MILKFKIEILSDYHLGAGYGRGIIDSIVLKNKNGIPIIRGTTLVGLLRQGMRDLLQQELLKKHCLCEQSGSSGDSYCMGTDEKLICPICGILGSPKYPRKWKISSARVEKQSILKQKKIVWRNRVNPRTRTSADKQLFNEETVGGKINFIFTVENSSDGNKALEEASFIVAAFRMVKNIGASRRRGKGACQFHLIDTAEQNKLLEVFKTKWLENKELNISGEYCQIEQTGEFFSTKRSFNLVLLTKEPLLIANRNEAGNKYQTNDYIPGHTFLGALAWQVANKCNLSDAKVYNKFINLFRKGGIKVSPLYPCWKIDDDIYPTIPSPHDFLTCKLYPGFEDVGHGVKGFSTETDEPKNCDKCSKKSFETPLEPLNKFVPLHPRPKTVDIDKREEMHITIDHKTGRTKTGDLFSFTLIESEQYFAGTIEIENWEDFVALSGIEGGKNDISFECRIGKASSRGYGRAQVWLKETQPEITFLGKPIRERVNIEKPIKMTLLTDTILTDKWGRFYTTLNNEILNQILGSEVEVLNTYVKTKNIDGFNAYLGLPKWRENALSAGSSIGFKIKNPANNNELLKQFEELEKEGIGLRKNEGFGRIAFNHPIYDENSDISVGINLPEFMRVDKQEEEIKNFVHWWKKYLAENLPQNDFLDDGWRAVARWLRENSKMPLDEMVKMFSSSSLDFHKPEGITELVTAKKPHREKKKFLEEKGKKGCNSLWEIFEKLSKRIESEEDKTIRKYLQHKAIEILSDFIASLQEEQR